MKIGEIKQKICEEVCKYRGANVGYDWHKICEVCPLTELRDWIPRKEKKEPESGERVLISSRDGIYIAFIDTEGSWRFESPYGGAMIEAWMPLPAPYQAITLSEQERERE